MSAKVRARRRPRTSSPVRADKLDSGTRGRTGRAMLTPPELARRWGVSPEKVVAFIRSGELRAVNVALRLHGRPRYRIDPADVTEFERRRSVAPVPKNPRRKQGPEDFVEFF